MTGAKTAADTFQNEFEEELFNFSSDWPLTARACLCKHTAALKPRLRVHARANIRMCAASEPNELTDKQKTKPQKKLSMEIIHAIPHPQSLFS